MTVKAEARAHGGAAGQPGAGAATPTDVGGGRAGCVKKQHHIGFPRASASFTRLTCADLWAGCRVWRELEGKGVGSRRDRAKPNF